MSGRTAIVAAVLGLTLALAGCAGTAPQTVGPPGSPSATSGVASSPAATPAVPRQWPPSVRLVKVAGGLDRPLYVTSDGTGDGVLYVVEQGGLIRAIGKDGRLAARPFLDISRLTAPGGERGLLGLAFSPKYASDGTFYIDYTDLNGDTHVDRVSNGGSDRKTILFVPQPYPNHNGGCIQFGPDGYLYIGMGDGGSGGDPGNRAQNPNQLLGKVLRVDVTTQTVLPGAGHSHPVVLPYGLPVDNAFTINPHGGYATGVGVQPGHRGEIFLLGMRNPWRFSFDRKTGDLFIGDVGQDAWEEIDVLPKGKGGFNMGWNQWEGDHPYPPGTKASPVGFTFPVLEYPHPDGESITGGYVYRGAAYPQWDGLYFYADYVKGWIAAGRGEGFSRTGTTKSGWSSARVLDTGFQVSSFGQDDLGEIYVCDYDGGAIYRMEAAK